MSFKVIPDLQSEFEVSSNELPNLEAVVGMEDLKAQLNVSMIAPFKNPQLFEEIGLTYGDKYILFGPPGCGKSFIARSIAGELKAKCFELRPSTTISKGYSAPESVSGVFNQARFHTPSVIIIDEVETLIEDRESHENVAFMRLFLDEMLIQFDDTANKNEGLLVVGTTNSPWYIDAAFLREGRFGKVIFVYPPDHKTRLNYFSRILIMDGIGKDDLEILAEKSQYFSFADINGVIKKARQEAVKNLLLQGKNVSSIADVKLSKELLEQAIKLQFSPTKAWFEKFESKSSKLHESLVLPVREFLKEFRKER